ncbi:hypothetical protein NPIL_215811 [Nephila pilipes]|uniref:Uncharacterized protein n=1 Tax=Nephila pilipes TaxID=299642 RepID=A0A8X6NFJ7_NEPPI|nr:hypothetical protein NPIL_215811 [Nephila pilipes]
MKIVLKSEDEKFLFRTMYRLPNNADGRGPKLAFQVDSLSSRFPSALHSSVKTSPSCAGEGGRGETQMVSRATGGWSLRHRAKMTFRGREGVHFLPPANEEVISLLRDDDLLKSR